MSEAEIDQFVSDLDSPMFIVTVATVAAGQESRSGCLVGFVTQCSIDPARFLVCISKTNHTYPVACEAEVLALHLLDSSQRQLAALFGESTGDEIDKFATVAWRPGPEGVPLLTDCRAWVVGDILELVDLGDHVGFVIRPTKVSITADPDPLCFSQVRDLNAGHSP